MRAKSEGGGGEAPIVKAGMVSYWCFVSSKWPLLSKANLGVVGGVERRSSRDPVLAGGRGGREMEEESWEIAYMGFWWLRLFASGLDSVPSAFRMTVLGPM